MKRIFAILIAFSASVFSLQAQFTLLHEFDGRGVSPIYLHYDNEGKIESQMKYLSSSFDIYKYPLGYFYYTETDRENGTYTETIYDKSYSVYKKNTYTFSVPSGYGILSVNKISDLFSDVIFFVELLANDYSASDRYKLFAYDSKGKKFYDFGSSTSLISVYPLFFEHKGNYCFFVHDNGANTSKLYKIDNTSSMVNAIMNDRPVVIAAPDRLTILSSEGTQDYLIVTSVNGSSTVNIPLDPSGKTTYMTDRLPKGTYVYSVGTVSGKFIVE